MKEKPDISNSIESNEDLEENTLSIDYWCGAVLNSGKDRYNKYLEEENESPLPFDVWRENRIKELSDKILESMKEEKTNMLSATMERGCNLSCAHCLYRDERSSEQLSIENDLASTIVNMVDQLPTQEETPYKKPQFLHDGRTLKKWHLDVFEEIAKNRPDVSLGLIDNGTYTKLLGEFKRREIKLDSLDVSIDGTEHSHNLQRDPQFKKAYDVAINGLRHAREITKSNDEGGKVTSLMTITTLNFKDIFEAADVLFQPNPDESAKDPKTESQLNYIDEFHIQPISPEFDEIKDLEISEEDMKIAWEQIKKLYLDRKEKGVGKIYFEIHRLEDMAKLAHVIGESKFYNAILDTTRGSGFGGVALHKIEFYIDGVQILYTPVSNFPLETILIDADGSARTAYSQQFTLDEYKKGVSKDGKDIKKYTIEHLDSKSKYDDVYKQWVEKWWEDFGKKSLLEEIAFFQNIKK